MSKPECPECEFVKNISENKSDLFEKRLLIAENELFAAFYTKKPVTDNHVTIVPKKHFSRIIEFSAEDWKAYGNLLQTIGVAGSMRSFNMLIPSGMEFGKHLVIHILPQSKEGFKIEWNPKEEITTEEIDKLELYVNEIKNKIPITGKTIQLKPDVPRKEGIGFEEITPGMPCLVHGMRHNCEYGPPKDVIPPIYKPKFEATSKIKYLKNDDLVTSVTLNGITKAYPINILDYHEIISDSIGDTHFAVSYCPLCASSLVFNRKINPKKPPTEFGVSGFLYQSDLLMYDQETDSLWSQIEGECVYGDYNGKELDLIPFQLMKWKDWKKEYPEGQVVSKDTGFSRDYEHFPYGEYVVSERVFFPVKKKDDANRLHPKTLVYAIEVSNIPKVYPEDYLLEEKLILDKIGDKSLLIAVDAANGVHALIPKLDEKTELTFSRTEEGLVDKETGSKWSFAGLCVDGKYIGKQLPQRADLLRMYYFAFVAFNPNREVEIYQNLHEKASWKERLFKRFKKEEKS